jgi:multidrug efflux pump subunit AcrA (membrane-fusion protein)
MIPITKGMHVFAGQVLGTLDDRELYSILKINQAQLEVAKAERDKSIEKVLAAQSVLVAMAEVQMMHEVNKRVERAYPEAEIRRAELVVAQAQTNLELQKYNIDEIKTREVIVRESELERTEVQIGLRKLVAQIDGMIVKIDAAEGEWLREGDPVLEIVQLDTLLVRVQVDAKEFGISDLDGKQAVIHVPFANGRTETFQGTVIFCNPLVQAGSNTLEVDIEVQNRRVGNFWQLLPGFEGVDIVIPL